MPLLWLAYGRFTGEGPMGKNLLGAVCSALVGMAAAVGTDKVPVKATAASKPAAETINASDLRWGEAPAVFPKGARLAVLHGNPSARGSFAVRLKLPDGYRLAPHWHSQDEQLTVLSGAFVLHMGDTMNADFHEITAGGYHFLPGRMHHAAETKGETVLDVHGNGPFDMHYLNPADDPSKTPEAAK
jgi:uncharacterized protein DUF4437